MGLKLPASLEWLIELSFSVWLVFMLKGECKNLRTTQNIVCFQAPLAVHIAFIYQQLQDTPLRLQDLNHKTRIRLPVRLFGD